MKWMQNENELNKSVNEFGFFGISCEILVKFMECGVVSFCIQYTYCLYDVYIVIQVNEFSLFSWDFFSCVAYVCTMHVCVRVYLILCKRNGAACTIFYYQSVDILSDKIEKKATTTTTAR